MVTNFMNGISSSHIRCHGNRNYEIRFGHHFCVAILTYRNKKHSIISVSHPQLLSYGVNTNVTSFILCTKKIIIYRYDNGLSSGSFKMSSGQERFRKTFHMNCIINILNFFC